MSNDEGEYSGLTVLELAQGVAAPYCGMLLAQHGARVIKIEPIEGGDWSRALGRRYGDFSANALIANRGKKSLAVNLKSSEGLAIVQRLAREADVVIENYRPGVIERFKLDYETLAASNTSVVYASLSGFGTAGPNKSLPATDTVMQGYSGLMSINRDGEGVPRRIDMLAIDMAAGLYLFQAVSAALYKRLKTGAGSRVTTSLLHCSLAFQHAKMVEFALSGSDSEPTGAPVGTFRTSDGFISINARRDVHFQGLCKLLGKDWASDARFATPEARVGNAELLTTMLDPIFSQKTTLDWCALLAEADILHAPVNDYRALFSDRQVAAIDVLQWDEMAGVGRFPDVRIPGLAACARSDDDIVPTIGQHTQQILREMKIADHDIERMRKAGVLK